MLQLRSIAYLDAAGTAEERLGTLDAKIAEFKAAFSQETGLLTYFKWWESKRGVSAQALFADIDMRRIHLGMVARAQHTCSS